VCLAEIVATIPCGSAAAQGGGVDGAVPGAQDGPVRLCPDGLTCVDLDPTPADADPSLLALCVPPCPPGGCASCDPAAPGCAQGTRCVNASTPFGMCFPDPGIESIAPVPQRDAPCGLRAVQDVDGSCVGGIPCRADAECPLQFCADATTGQPTRTVRACTGGYCRGPCVSCGEACPPTL
jgi:hypothetical protein